MITTLISRQVSAFFLVLALSFAVQAQSTQPAALTPAQLRDMATLLSGQEPSGGLPNPVRDNLKWQIYTKEVQNNWAEYTKKIGAPMVNWANQHLGMSTDTVFYPFSGPDFTTVYQLFPQTKRYVMVAMQHAGRPMDLSAHSPLITDQSLEQLTSAWKLFGTHGFFVTEYLERYYYASQGKIGASTFLAIFLKLQGFDIERVTPIKVDTNGEIEELSTETPLWSSVRFNATKNGQPIVLDYLRIDLSNQGLQTVPDHYKFIQKMSVHPTLFKAASHLPQNSNFNMIAKAVLDNAPLVVQDETGLNYTALSQQFNSALFGKFVIAHQAFQNYHGDLARAFAQRQDVQPLNFRFGYYKDGNYVLMVARRK